MEILKFLFHRHQVIKVPPGRVEHQKGEMERKTFRVPVLFCVVCAKGWLL